MIVNDLGALRLAMLGFLLTALPFSAPAISDSGPIVITTDTPAYCQKLIERVGEVIHAAAQPPSATVTVLSSEGRRLCDEGLTRPGILRLRRALIILRQELAAPAPAEPGFNR